MHEVASEVALCDEALKHWQQIREVPDFELDLSRAQSPQSFAEKFASAVPSAQ